LTIAKEGGGVAFLALCFPLFSPPHRFRNCQVFEYLTTAYAAFSEFSYFERNKKNIFTLRNFCSLHYAMEQHVISNKKNFWLRTMIQNILLESPCKSVLHTVKWLILGCSDNYVPIFFPPPADKDKILKKFH
jgi:hypothetical protein